MPYSQKKGELSDDIHREHFLYCDSMKGHFISHMKLGMALDEVHVMHGKRQ